MKEVNADLYEILKENETRLVLDDGKVIALAFIDLRDLRDFVEAIDMNWFCDNEKQVILRGSYVAIEINDIIESEGHLLSSYKNCFYDWKDFEEQILAEEE